MDSADLLLCGKRMVNQLRSEIHLSYDTCTDNAVLVLTSMLDFMEERSVSSLDLHTLQELRREIGMSQNNLSEDDIRESWDYAQIVGLMQKLENYRKGSDNREMMWQGGTWDRNDESRSSPTNILSSIRKIFNDANPLILREVVSYPGTRSLAEFQLVEILISELQWVLQNVEVSNLSAASKCANDICSVLLTSVKLQPESVTLISSSATLRSVIFRLLNKLIISENDDNAVAWYDRFHPSDWTEILPILKLGTVLLSSASRDVSTFHELQNKESIEEVFPELERCIKRIVTQSSLLDAGVTVHQHLAAFCISLSSFYLYIPPAVTIKDHPLSLHRLFNAATKDKESTSDVLKLLEIMIEIVTDWWNHELQCSPLNGNDPEREFGLMESVPLTAIFLAESVVLKYEVSRSGDNIMFYRADLIKQTNKALSEDSSIFIVSQSTCDVLRQICKRIINDHGLQEPIYGEAEKVLRTIADFRDGN